MGTRSGQPNTALAHCLDALGWSPKTLARKLNRVFGAGTVAESAPYHWRDGGALPRSPLPVMTAYVLSQELGRTVSTSDLWQGRSADSAQLVPADTDLARPWTLPGLRSIVEDWVLRGLIDRRQYLALSGTGLLALVTHYLDGTAGGGTYAPGTGTAQGDPLVEQVEGSLTLLRRLDSERGGARHLSYVGAQFRAIGLLVHEGGHPAPVTARLVRALAETGQLAGWMALDAADHGLAQRYFTTALRAAHQVNDLPLCANILAYLSFQAASRDHPADAVTLGEAARRASATAPITVQASVLSRLSYAYATAGRVNDFSRTREAAREAIERRGDGGTPGWMHHLTGHLLDTNAGSTLVQLGRAQRRDGNTAAARRSLSQGADLLDSGAHAIPPGAPGQRRALVEGAWLALGHSARGELELACQVGRTAADRLATVSSPRSTALLHQLAADLRRRKRSPYVKDFLPDLEHALAQPPRHGQGA